MALITKITTWSAGDKLTATALNNERDNILDALDGTDQINLKTKYNAADLPTVQLVNSHASGYGLQVGDGSNDDLFGVKSTGVIESKVVTGTAPLIVASTTKVDNLNADTVDGVEVAALALLAGASFEGTVTTKNNARIEQNETHTTPAGTIPWDADGGSFLNVRLEEDGVMGSIANAEIGGLYILKVQNWSPGGHALTWHGDYEFPDGGSPLTITQSSLATDIFLIFAESTGSFLVISFGQWFV